MMLFRPSSFEMFVPISPAVTAFRKTVKISQVFMDRNVMGFMLDEYCCRRCQTMVQVQKREESKARDDGKGHPHDIVCVCLLLSVP